MSDLPTTEQAREALQPGFITDRLRIMVPLTKAYVDGRLIPVPVCPDCVEGFVPLPDFDGTIERVADNRCPSCGGTGVNPEVKNAIADVLHDHGQLGEPHNRQHQTKRWQDCGRADVHGGVADKIVAALLAVIKEQK